MLDANPTRLRSLTQDPTQSRTGLGDAAVVCAPQMQRKRRSLKPKKNGTARSLDSRVAEELGRISKVAEDKGWGPAELSRQTGRKNTSTWDGYRNGSREPNLLTVDEFAGAVGLRVRVITQDVRVHPDGTVHIPDGGGNIVRDADELMDMFERLPPAEQEKVRFHFRREKGTGNPPEPGEQTGQ